MMPVASSGTEGTRLALQPIMTNDPRFHVQIVPTERITPFEATLVADDNSLAATDRNLIRNPFLVTPLDPDQFLLLEEAPRLAAVVASGIRQVPVQLCRPDDFRILVEPQALFGIDRASLTQIVERAAGLVIFAEESRPLPEHFLPVVIDFSDGTQQALGVLRSEATGYVEGLRYLLTAIDSVGRFAPYLNSWSGGEPLVKTSTADAVLFPPAVNLADLAEAARDNRLFPAGLVRIEADSRILAIDFPASVLLADLPIDQKTAFLHDLIALRRQTNKTAIVQGRVYILNL